LQRLVANSYANDHTNWIGAPPTAGRTNYTVTPPIITVQPQNASVAVGEMTTLNVGIFSYALYSLQWRCSGTNLPGAIYSPLVLTNAQLSHAGSYSVVVSNASGMVTNTIETLIVGLPPSIVSPPVSQFVAQGGNVMFTADANGNQPLAFQWCSNSVLLAGQTSPLLSLNHVQPHDSASYQVVITNLFGSVTSAPAALSVAGPATLSKALQISSGAVQLTIQGVAGHVYEVEATRDFVHWLSLGRATNILGPLIFSDPSTNLDYRFYRATVDPVP